MIAKLLISSSLEDIKKEILKILEKAHINRNHPDLLYFDSEQKLGIEQSKAIKEHFSIKPYQATGKILIIENAAKMTTEAQNALLKTLEEPPEEAIIVLASLKKTDLLPTVISRCQLIYPGAGPVQETFDVFAKDLEKLLGSSLKERFEYIENLKQKEDFLHALSHYFRQLLHKSESRPQRQEVIMFLKELLQTERWSNQNVNLRGILEYLMLRMPSR